MKTYELTYIVSPEITSEEAQAKAKTIEQAVLSKEGIILKQANPIAKTLSYPIKKHASGFFGVLEFQLEEEKLAEIEEIIARPSGSPGKIVRHMILIKKAQNPMKERRARIKPAIAIGPEPKISTDTQNEKPVTKEKVELKDIEEQLDEILG